MTTIIFRPGGKRVTVDGRTLAEAQAEAVARIKADAQERILSRYPFTAQLNAQARATELLLARSSRAWTAAETAEALALQGLRDWIKAVRDASNTAEASVMAAKTNDAADAVAASWPA